MLPLPECGRWWPISTLPPGSPRSSQRAEWIDDGPAVGATFRGYNHHPRLDMTWDVVCTVTALEPEQVWEWTIGNPDNKVAKWRFDLSPADDGEGSVLRFSAEMGPGPSGLTPAIEKMPDREEEIVAGRLDEWRQNMTATVEGIKELAEAG